MYNFKYNKFNNKNKKKKNQWTCSIFDMLYLPCLDQKMIKDRKTPSGIIEKMQK
jgi:hypothetical protein